MYQGAKAPSRVPRHLWPPMGPDCCYSSAAVRPCTGLSDERINDLVIVHLRGDGSRLSLGRRLQRVPCWWVIVTEQPRNCRQQGQLCTIFIFLLFLASNACQLTRISGHDIRDELLHIVLLVGLAQGSLSGLRGLRPLQFLTRVPC